MPRPTGVGSADDTCPAWLPGSVPGPSHAVRQYALVCMVVMVVSWLLCLLAVLAGVLVVVRARVGEERLRTGQWIGMSLPIMLIIVQVRLGHFSLETASVGFCYAAAMLLIPTRGHPTWLAPLEFLKPLPEEMRVPHEIRRRQCEKGMMLMALLGIGILLAYALLVPADL